MTIITSMSCAMSRRARGLVYLDGDTLDVPRHLGSGDARRRRRNRGDRRGNERRAQQCLRRDASPSHHAEHNKPMGFCFFDQAAIAARYAQRTCGITRAAVDGFRRPPWQWHAGHFLGRPHRDVLLDTSNAAVSRYRCIPGARPSDTVVNAPLHDGDGSAKFRSAFDNLILPQLQEIRTELLIISAGFDAHRRDPLASLNLDAEDFGWSDAQADGSRRQHRRWPHCLGTRGWL